MMRNNTTFWLKNWLESYNYWLRFSWLLTYSIIKDESHRCRASFHLEEKWRRQEKSKKVWISTKRRSTRIFTMRVILTLGPVYYRGGSSPSPAASPAGGGSGGCMSGPSCQESGPTRLLRQMTGHMEQPRVQQQHRHPQNSHLRARYSLGPLRTNVSILTWHWRAGSSSESRSPGSLWPGGI